MNEDNDFFLKQMKGVNPIKKNNRVEKEQPKLLKKNNKRLKTNEKKLSNSAQTIKNPQTTSPHYDLQKINIKKNIKKRTFKIDKKIDFHGKTLLEAEDQFYNTITMCYQNGLRCLLFVTGKGLYTTEARDNNKYPKLYHGVIRSAFLSWVKSRRFSKYILSYELASIEHGGDGAFYVYLRKKN